MATILTILVGQIGSGKTTWLAWNAARTHQLYPSYPIVSNVPIKFRDGLKAEYQEDVLKFLAMKIIKEDTTQMDVLVDEAAQAGLESRGSGLKATDSRLVTLARKANVNMFFASQLMSMTDKRLQWNGNFYIVCDFNFITPEAMARFIPDYFSYAIYNENYVFQYMWGLDGWDAEKHIFPLFDTWHIPFRDQLKKEFQQYYWAKDRYHVDMEAFKRDEEEFEDLIAKYKRQDPYVT